MQEFINQIVIDNQSPLLTAFILGILMIINPCPIITNLSSISYILKNNSDTKSSFINQMLFSLGRFTLFCFMCSILPWIIQQGFSTEKLQHILSEYGEKLFGILLIIMGLLFLNPHHHHHNDDTCCHHSPFGFLKKQHLKKYVSSFVLGIFIALIFCPYTAVLFFGIYIPFVSVSQQVIGESILFSLGTTLPITFASIIITFGYKNISQYIHQFEHAEKWFLRIFALIFITLGIIMLIHAFGHHHI